MNLWKKYPKRPVSGYPGFDKCHEEWDVISDNLFTKKKRVHMYSRGFKHLAWTQYKVKSIITVTQNGKTKRVRYYGLTKNIKIIKGKK